MQNNTTTKHMEAILKYNLDDADDRMAHLRCVEDIGIFITC